ncbi:TraV family lipoprotein [Cereibacter sphaeroides]|uniref:TraV family lipoprotein n=1 Tax=Cereibacter sphaeroides TaxID=1063 RepID=UPI001CA4C072|nr:TraV family lipoprotein [Cereibacter sphaeroides]
MTWARAARSRRSARPSATRSARKMSQSPLGVGSGKGGKLTVVSQSSMGDGGAPYRAQQYRVPEEVGTLWIAPHRDADGLLYEASFVHFVVREARWASQ